MLSGPDSSVFIGMSPDKVCPTSVLKILPYDRMTKVDFPPDFWIPVMHSFPFKGGVRGYSHITSAGRGGGGGGGWQMLTIADELKMWIEN